MSDAPGVPMATCPGCQHLPSCTTPALTAWVYACGPCGLTGAPSPDIAEARASWNRLANAPGPETLVTLDLDGPEDDAA